MVKKNKIDSICASENQEIKSGESHVLPIHSSSAFSYESIEDSIAVFTGEKSGFVYGRFGNPTIDSVERKLAALESHSMETSAYCILTSSGMSAISTLLLSLLSPGDAVMTQGNLYGGSTELLNTIISKNNIDILLEDLTNLSKLEEIFKQNKNIKVIYFESPSNPTLSCTDIESLSKLSRKHGKILVMDNTFSTALIQQPLSLGVDYVIYSTTKFLNGHGNSIAGAILCKTVEKRKRIWNYMKLLGTNCNAFDAWLLHNGLKTLAIRMERHCSNALSLAKYLEAHSKVKRVNYPGLESNTSHDIALKQMKMFGAVLSFELEGTIENAMKFMNACVLCTIASTLGNVDTLLLHPATSSHLNVDKDIRISQGISDGLIRVSVGIENITDIIEDIDQAIENAFK